MQKWCMAEEENKGLTKCLLRNAEGVSDSCFGYLTCLFKKSYYGFQNV